ncbi:hypothetical protein P152DRAFT_1536 [Eremomyces bilateralis CBS 781.70]|uniref:Uncharacterized protein n=1 Tax=Eremomyces bilateralis CBS 781.70 TaxID=1392243 RepID=A0A6G1GFH2_9PEZI|nr:uncharacterized protein P152DRAFT_1536 [Eremomyces bilateralis CBS 781.70]KAF1816818.1 hypothetical protein P152DRAFT_1536 [Eremomyces bilateralis CBS 781.70]
MPPKTKGKEGMLAAALWSEALMFVYVRQQTKERMLEKDMWIGLLQCKEKLRMEVGDQHIRSRSGGCGR